MALWRVVDSGVFIASLFVETLSQQAEALLLDCIQNSIQIAAPMLLEYEVVSVIRKAMFVGRASQQEAEAALSYILSYRITYHRTPDLMRRALSFATQFNQPRAYDAQYLAVAEHLGCELWTADERLYNSVHVALPWVKWLGHQTA